MANENYEKDSQGRLTQLLSECGWAVQSLFWEKGDLRLAVDRCGVFLFQRINAHWVRTHGLSFGSMYRAIRHGEIVFIDGARLHLEHGFTPAPTKRGRR